jgi:DNA primase
MDLFSFIKSKAPILSVIQEYTTLKPAGSYWKGVCPIHHEKTPSFTVSPAKEIYYCFGCHSGGDVISFIAAAENCSPKEAALLIAQRNNIQLPDELTRQKDFSTINNRQMYVKVHQHIMQWCQKNVTNNRDVESYLQSRNISKEAREKFCIGYFPKGYQAIDACIAAARKSGILIEDLLDAHVIFESNKRSHAYFSPFEGRILFPIFSQSGECLGFGGRIYQDDDARAKYINSQDHDYFCKGSQLFGLSQAKKYIQETKTAILVEGYTDCIALHDHGYRNSIATLGTACTLEQLQSIARYTDTLIVMYDGDNAGKKAMLRLAQLCWESSLDIRVATLPAEHDPASLLQSGNSIQLYIEQAQDIFTFFIAEITKKNATPSLNEVLLHVKEVIDLVKTVRDPIKQELLLKQAAQACNISYATLMQSFKNHQSKKQTSELREVVEKKMAMQEIERELFILLLIAPHYLELLDITDLDLIHQLSSHSLKPLVAAYFNLYKQHMNITIHDFLNTITEAQKAIISQLVLSYENTLPSKEIFILVLRSFYKKQWKNLLNDVKIKLEENGEKSFVNEHLSYIQDLKQKMISKGVL